MNCTSAQEAYGGPNVVCPGGGSDLPLTGITLVDLVFAGVALLLFGIAFYLGSRA